MESSTPPPPRGRFRVTRPLPCTCAVSYRAPFSGGHQVTLPPGTLLSLDRDPAPGSSASHALPEPVAAWEPWLVGQAQAAARDYAGYDLVIEHAALAAAAVPDAGSEVAPDPARLLHADAYTGCLLGSAVGDALALPLEGLSPQRIARLTGGTVRHRLLPGTGMLSDDTEHAACVAQALVEAGRDPERFARGLARRLRWWLLGLPAGIGLATLRALVKSWLGFPPGRSGVHSAGNGPAMRSALLGVHARDDVELRHALVRACTRLTHTDPRAEAGARLVADLAAANTEAGDPAPALAALLDAAAAGDDDFAAACRSALASQRAGQSAAEHCAAHGMGRGVSGFVNQTVPVAALIVLRHPRDFAAALHEVLDCGGDTDTVGAIVGGIVGAGCGPDGIPREWLDGVRDWPRSTRWLRDLALTLAAVDGLGVARRPPGLNPLAVLLRNLLFILIVLAHGFRRLLPPYG
ncbi:MAG TPA: ADP-ribosylglycohydrolase family protein [Gammaproteobacteria bacterium]